MQKLDRVQMRFLKDAGAEEADALMYFNLAPLSVRRDIAMMGVLHRTVAGRGPPHFKQHFKLDQGLKMMDPKKRMLL